MLTLRRLLVVKRPCVSTVLLASNERFALMLTLPSPMGSWTRHVITYISRPTALQVVVIAHKLETVQSADRIFVHGAGTDCRRGDPLSTAEAEGEICQLLPKSTEPWKNDGS